jgi:uncharacterized protein (DUF362 family)
VSENLTRRDFLVRLGLAGATAAGIAGAAWHFRRRPGWTPRLPGLALPDWRVERDAASPVMAIARGTDPARLVAAALEEMGGMSAFVAPGDVVLVKPNAAFDRPAWQGATTNPDVLGALVRACREAGAAEVLVTDNPIHAPEGAFRKTGLGRAAEDAGGEVILPQPGDFRPVSLPATLLDGWPALLEPLLRADKVIGTAPVKDHNLAMASLTLKNWYGLLGGARNRLHQKLDEAIADLARMVRPTLSVLDGTRILFRNGPTGGSPEDVRAGDVVAVSTDGVALDAFGATLLELVPEEVAYLGLAQRRGLGTADWRSIDPREVTA